MTHLLNYVWPNIFETSPHVVNAVNGAIDGCRLALGPAVVMSYTLQVRFWLKGVKVQTGGQRSAGQCPGYLLTASLTSVRSTYGGVLVLAPNYGNESSA